MKLRPWLGGALLAAAATCALAHAHLEGAVPADNSVLDKAPAALVLRFSESARLTALWIAKDDGQKHKLEPPAVSGSQLSVPLPPLTAGRYVLSWRALSADGHVVPGQIRFTLKQ